MHQCRRLFVIACSRARCEMEMNGEKHCFRPGRCRFVGGHAHRRATRPGRSRPPRPSRRRSTRTPSYVEPGCDPVAKPGVVAFRGILKAEYGRSRPRHHCGPAASATPSDHHARPRPRLSLQRNNSAQLAEATELLNWLLATDQYGNKHALARRLGIVYLIWNHKIWRAYDPSAGWQPYSGAEPAHRPHPLQLRLAGRPQADELVDQRPGVRPCGGKHQRRPVRRSARGRSRQCDAGFPRYCEWHLRRRVGARRRAGRRPTTGLRSATPMATALPIFSPPRPTANCITGTTPAPASSPSCRMRASAGIRSSGSRSSISMVTTRPTSWPGTAGSSTGIRGRARATSAAGSGSARAGRPTRSSPQRTPTATATATSGRPTPAATSTSGKGPAAAPSPSGSTVGGGWNGFGPFNAMDVNGDGKADLVAVRTSDGHLLPLDRQGRRDLQHRRGHRPRLGRLPSRDLLILKEHR